MLNHSADLLTASTSKQGLVVGENSDLFRANLLIAVPINEPKILEVTGTGVTSVPTETAQIQVAIEIEAATAAEVQTQIAQRATAVVEQLNQLGVQQLQTISISLDPNFEFNQGARTLVGFIGRNVLQFKVPISQAGTTIDAAIAAGANSIQNINFLPDEQLLQQARLEALSLAVQDAQTQALAVLNPLGSEPIAITGIDILGVNNSPNFIVPFGVTTFAATTPVLGGPQDITANVALDITYA